MFQENHVQRMAEVQALCPHTTVLQEVIMPHMRTAIMLDQVATLHPRRALLRTACKQVMLSSIAKRAKGLDLLSLAP